jgi:2-oxoglutarate ferredoxin oxidoreductase subunit alpha
MIHSLTIVLSGSAGQGLKTLETLLSHSIKQSYHLFTTAEIMSRIRGGNNTVELRIGHDEIYAYKDQIDLLFLLNSNSYYRLPKRINKNTQIFGEMNYLTPEQKKDTKGIFNTLNVSDLAKEAGSVLYSNIVLYGFISGLLHIDKNFCINLIQKTFQNKNESILEGNKKAFHQGYTESTNYSFKFNLKTTSNYQTQKIINGTEAISIGAIAGGINYISSYPMSPATGVLEYLAHKGDDFDIIVEQAEDEIAAINMSLGAWYAGARSMVTTSGGGFALMEEAVSLAGITEMPSVIHIAQRPGPGTGLPTRTEQGDLNLAVYSGHGEFPRIVLAPGNLEDGVLLTQKAFYLADKYQVPVFILSDQYYLDSKAPIHNIRLPESPLKSFIIETDESYLRYKFTENNISPRGIPNFGEGLVKVDSDEHDEQGSITEEFDVRIKMNDKRLSKEKAILEEYIEPAFIGPTDYKYLVVGWGSTYGVLKEAIDTQPNHEIGFLHIKQLFPLKSSLKKYFEQASKVLIVENNATGQLNNLLKLYLQVTNTESYLKYNGVPFTIEEIDQKLKEVF